MTLHIHQSVARHIEELTRLGLSRGGSFEEVMRELGDDRRRRRLASCFGAEDRVAAAKLAFGANGGTAVEALAGHPSIDVAPVWTPGAGDTGSWGAAICVKAAGGVEPLVSLPDAARSSVREVAFNSRKEEMTGAIETQLSRWSFPTLISLELRGAKGAARVAALLARCSTGLRRLAVSAAGPEGGVLEAVSALSSIEALELLVDVDADALAELVAALPLRRLMLHGTDVSTKLAEALGAAPALEVLSLRSSDIKKATFKKLTKDLAQRSRLAELELGNCSLLDGKSLELLSPVHSLRRLRIEGEKLDGAFVSTLSAPLDDLDLSGVALKAPVVRWIASSLSGLRRLRLDQTGLKADGAELLSGLAQLCVLNIDGGRVSPALPALCRMQNLFRLRVPLHTDDEAILLQAPVPSGLRELDMDGVSLSPRGAAALATWPLAGLNICSDAVYDRKPRAYIGSEGAKALGKCTSLEWLHVGGHRIDGEGVAALGDLPRLRWAHLTQNPLAGGVSKLSSAPALRVIYLDDCELPPTAPRSLSAIVTLEELNLWDNHIDGTHLADFARLPNLRELNLVNNPIPDDAIKALRRLLPRANIVA